MLYICTNICIETIYNCKLKLSIAIVVKAYIQILALKLSIMHVYGKYNVPIEIEVA